ncbi:unnamed protein product [Allacma fusca]|uniref:Uncharacterized protein n=1 Tax=Allacma fusca TaxID=39272 RepID=A0A8J2JG01_9HEXA|nr:unnamed protein product [Allacma fusca]
MVAKKSEEETMDAAVVSKQKRPLSLNIVGISNLADHTGTLENQDESAEKHERIANLENAKIYTKVYWLNTFIALTFNLTYRQLNVVRK